MATGFLPRKLDGMGNERGFFSFESKEKQKTSFDAVKAAAAKRNRSAVPRFRAGRQSRPCCAHAHREKPQASRKNKLVYYSVCPAVFLLPGSSHDAVQVTGANCLLSCPSRFAGWLLCSFLPREESAYPLPRPIPLYLFNSLKPMVCQPFRKSITSSCDRPFLSA